MSIMSIILFFSNIIMSKQLEYISTVDYRMQLLAFAKKNPNLLCSNFEETVDQFLDLTRRMDNMNYNNYVYYSGVEFALETRLRDEALLRSLKEPVKVPSNWIFMTVNLDDKTNINGHIMLSLARKICAINAIAGVPLFTSGIFSLEKNRKDGFGKNYIHHHIHFLLNLSMHLRVGKILEKVFAVSGIKEYCKKITFIDIKTPDAKKYENRAQPYEVNEAYVMGLKCDDKAECIGADILWRMSLGLETFYEYN